MHEQARPNVLLVEDEFLIAAALKMLLESQGARVVGPVGHVAVALELIAAAEPLDCALLDIRLAGEPVFPVADALLARGVRFAFLSCYDRSVLPPAHRDATWFNKVEDPKVLFRWVKGS